MTNLIKNFIKLLYFHWWLWKTRKIISIFSESYTVLIWPTVQSHITIPDKQNRLYELSLVTLALEQGDILSQKGNKSQKKIFHKLISGSSNLWLTIYKVIIIFIFLFIITTCVKSLLITRIYWMNTFNAMSHSSHASEQCHHLFGVVTRHNGRTDGRISTVISVTDRSFSNY